MRLTHGSADGRTQATTFKAALLGALLALVFLSAGSVAAANAPEPGVPEPGAPTAAPTVDGLFYGPAGYPDSSNYIFLAENPGLASIYYYLDGATLYIAVVVQRNANDNVFGITGGGAGSDQAYLQSAGWNGNGANHRFNQLPASDHLEFQLTCDGGAIDETWIHGYVYDTDNDSDPAEADWLSGPADPSIGSPPPTAVTLIDTASSLMWNLNNYASGGSPAWDITLGGIRNSGTTYKSPASGGAADTDVTDEVGYPADTTQPITFDITHGWEWPLVYEFSVDVTNCGGTPIAVNVISAHNSPAKEGEEDVPVPIYDLGDLPNTYTTLLANNGPQHKIQIGDPVLGTQVDGEPDGSPTVDADGDNNTGNDDEVGIVFDTGDWYDGSGEIMYTVSTANGCLNMWIDFANDAGVVTQFGDGDFEDSAGGVSEHVVTDLEVTPGAGQNLSFPLPAGIVHLSELYVRARITPRDAGGGCAVRAAYPGLLADPNGPAVGGEVEDHLVILPEPTAIVLQSVQFSSHNHSGVLVLAVVMLLVGTAALLVNVKRRRSE